MTVEGHGPGGWIRWWLPSIGTLVWLALFWDPVVSAKARTHQHRWGHLHSRAAWHLDDRTRASDPLRGLLPHCFWERLITREGLSQVVYALAWKALGWNGVACLAAALIATCFWVVHRQLLMEGNEVLLSTGLVLLAAMGCAVHWVARPLLFTHLMVALYVWQLRAFDKGNISARQLFSRLVPLMVPWANLHGQFFVGILLIVMYLLADLWEMLVGMKLCARADRSRPWRWGD